VVSTLVENSQVYLYMYMYIYIVSILSFVSLNKNMYKHIPLNLCLQACARPLQSGLHTYIGHLFPILNYSTMLLGLASSQVPIKASLLNQLDSYGSQIYYFTN